jgi:hypothetical protein
MTTPLADYVAQRQAFLALFEPDCDCRILLVHGESGSGKTTFLEHCREQTPSHIPCLPIELRRSAVGVPEFFSRSGRWLGWSRMSHFKRRVTELSGAPLVQVGDNVLAGMNNSINIALHADTLADREERRSALTDAWFDDLDAVGQPALVVFDTYEQATSEVKDWLSGPFLARVAQVKPLRVVVAGQEVPESHTIEWGHCCDTQELLGVTEARHWLPVVRALGRRIAVESPESWLAGVCHVLKGRPGEIMKVIRDLPRAEAIQ